jgi:outer membrane protein
MRKLATLIAAAVFTLTGLTLFAQAKIVVVDTMKVASDCKEGKKIQAILKAFHDQKQSDITAKETALKALEEQGKDPKISAEKQEEIRTQFNNKLYEYQAFAKASQDEMEAKTQKLQGEFQEKLGKVIQSYAEAKSISLIVEKGICLYNADTMEATADIVAAMNQAYPGT